MPHCPDDTDWRILHLLQHDARISNKELADKVGKSVSAVHERVRKLQEEGYVRQFAAILNNKLIQRGLVAFVFVRLNQHAHDMLVGFEREVIAFEEVMECYHMSGECDFLLKVALNDLDEYHDFIRHRLSTCMNLGTVQSFFVLNEAKRETAFPLRTGV